MLSLSLWHEAVTALSLLCSVWCAGETQDEHPTAASIFDADHHQPTDQFTTTQHFDATSMVLSACCSDVCSLQCSPLSAVLCALCSVVCSLQYSVLSAVLSALCSTLCSLQYAVLSAVLSALCSVVCSLQYSVLSAVMSALCNALCSLQCSVSICLRQSVFCFSERDKRREKVQTRYTKSGTDGPSKRCKEGLTGAGCAGAYCGARAAEVRSNCQ